VNCGNRRLERISDHTALALSESQKADAIPYEIGQLVEFHQRVQGGFKSGEQWEVSRKSAEGVYVARNGQEKLLPLDQAAGFNLYWRDTMPVAIGEHLLITKNNRQAKLRNGDLRQVKAIVGQTITLENGYKLGLSKPLHVR
jgi:hypothetical protein